MTLNVKRARLKQSCCLSGRHPNLNTPRRRRTTPRSHYLAAVDLAKNQHRIIAASRRCGASPVSLDQIDREVGQPNGRYSSG